MFFKYAVEDLKEKDHKVLCTGRNYRECLRLSKLREFELKIIGKYGGSSKYDKLRASSRRIYDLAKEVDKFQPDLCVSFSSPEAARVAFGLGIPHITFNDSPHAYAVQRLTIPFVTYLLCPWIIPYSAWNNLGISKKQVVRYHALDPVAWLGRETRQFDRDQLKQKYNLRKKSTIVIRPEESKASYLIDKNTNIDNILESIVETFHKTTNILVLCRYQDQIRQYNEKYGRKIKVLKNVVDGAELISIADIFVGGGGTMTAESALMGKPTISISPIKFYVDDFLIRNALIHKVTNSTQIVKLLIQIQNDNRFSIKQKNRAQQILKNMEDPTNTLMKIVDRFVAL